MYENPLRPTSRGAMTGMVLYMSTAERVACAVILSRTRLAIVGIDRCLEWLWSIPYRE